MITALGEFWNSFSVQGGVGTGIILDWMLGKSGTHVALLDRGMVTTVKKVYRDDSDVYGSTLVQVTAAGCEAAGHSMDEIVSLAWDRAVIEYSERCTSPTPEGGFNLMTELPTVVGAIVELSSRFRGTVTKVYNSSAPAAITLLVEDGNGNRRAPYLRGVARVIELAPPPPHRYVHPTSTEVVLSPAEKLRIAEQKVINDNAARPLAKADGTALTSLARSVTGQLDAADVLRHIADGIDAGLKAPSTIHPGTDYDGPFIMYFGDDSVDEANRWTARLRLPELVAAREHDKFIVCESTGDYYGVGMRLWTSITKGVDKDEAITLDGEVVEETPSLFEGAPPVRTYTDGSQVYGPYVSTDEPGTMVHALAEAYTLDGGDLQEDPSLEPKYPEGTPEYDTYAAELREELGKFAKGEEPYPIARDVGRAGYRKAYNRMLDQR
jgi:hypothetical protein